MKILIVGGGGREHAILRSLSGEGRQLFCAPGNAGIANLATCVDIKINDLDGIVKFATEEKIDLALVSQDEPLVLGMVDALQAEGLRDSVKVCIGGAPVTQTYCEEIGADIYTSNAVELAEMLAKL